MGEKILRPGKLDQSGNACLQMRGAGPSARPVEGRFEHGMLTPSPEKVSACAPAKKKWQWWIADEFALPHISIM